MSKPMTRSCPACWNVRTIPTTPPARAGEDGVLAAEPGGFAQCTLDCMNRSRMPFSRAATSSTYRRSTGER
ncbi:hypothetical protein SMICM17S_08468 [Streptomyces microflavus]